MKLIYLCLAYLVGSIPFGYLAFRLGSGDQKDIRRFGSRSTGATNVLRLKGWAYAVPVAIMDVAKSALPVWLALRLFGDRRLAMATAVFVILGHCFPIFLRFRGGKGVSTAMGAYLVLSFLNFLLGLAVFVAFVAATRFVSLGSLAATLSFPCFALLTSRDQDLAVFGLAVFILIAIRHAANIGRLCQGTERRLGDREKVESE